MLSIIFLSILYCTIVVFLSIITSTPSSPTLKEDIVFRIGAYLSVSIISVIIALDVDNRIRRNNIKRNIQEFYCGKYTIKNGDIKDTIIINKKF